MIKKTSYCEFSGKVNYLMARFLEKNAEKISGLVKGEEFKQKEVIEDDDCKTRYDVLLVYRQGGWFSESFLNCFVNGEFVARAYV